LEDPVTKGEIGRLVVGVTCQESTSGLEQSPDLFIIVAAEQRLQGELFGRRIYQYVPLFECHLRSHKNLLSVGPCGLHNRRVRESAHFHEAERVHQGSRDGFEESVGIAFMNEDV